MDTKDRVHALVEELTNPTKPDNVTEMPQAPALKNKNKPQYPIENEQPWHRTVACLMLEGKTAIDISKIVKKSAGHIRQVAKQDWFKELVTEIAQLQFDDDISGLLESGAKGAVLELMNLSSCAESETVRRSASSDLLNQYFKTKPEPVESTPENPQDELEAIQAELANLKKQETA